MGLSNVDYVQRFVKTVKEKESLELVYQALETAGFEVISKWAMGSSLEELMEAGRASVNLVVSATGLEVAETIEAAEMLAADGIDAKVINIHTIKPLDEELVVAAAKETGKVVTIEEHSVIGGLGSAVCDVLAEKAPTKVMKIGVNDVFGESGPALALIKKYGLDAESIYNKVKAFV